MDYFYILFVNFLKRQLSIEYRTGLDFIKCVLKMKESLMGL